MTKPEKFACYTICAAKVCRGQHLAKRHSRAFLRGCPANHGSRITNVAVSVLSVPDAQSQIASTGFPVTLLLLLSHNMYKLETTGFPLKIHLLFKKPSHYNYHYGGTVQPHGLSQIPWARMTRQTIMLMKASTERYLATRKQSVSEPCMSHVMEGRKENTLE